MAKDRTSRMAELATAMAVIPGFTNTAVLRLPGGSTGASLLGTVGVNSNLKNPNNLVFAISADVAEKAGMKPEDKVHVLFKGKTFVITKGGHRKLKHDGSQLRCTTIPIYLVPEQVRMPATVVPADGDTPAYIKFELPDEVQKNPAYWTTPVEQAVEGGEEAQYDDEVTVP